MPLRPEMRAFLDSLPPEPGDRPDVAQLRADAAVSAAHLPTRAVDVGEVHDVTWPGPDGPLPARVYTPRRTPPHPVTVYFHGGGFAAYSIDTHDMVARELCATSGSLVVSAGYRLAPETPFPGAVADVLAAVRWAHGQAATWGGDPDVLAVAGDSAGANLAISCTFAARDGGLPRLRAQLLIYPVTDLSHRPSDSLDAYGEGYGLTRTRMQWFHTWYLPAQADADDPRASPLYAEDHRDLPPALVVTAEFDPLRDDGRRYADALAAAGGEVVYRCGEGLIHGFANLTGISDAAAAVVDDAGAWLGERLRSPDTG